MKEKGIFMQELAKEANLQELAKEANWHQIMKFM